MCKKFLILLTFTALLFSQSVFANQIGVNFADGTVGVLGDYEENLGDWKLGLDAQAQKTDNISLAANVSFQRNFGRIGLQPFASLNRDDVANTYDAGGLVNFAIGGLDIAAGASFRGANPTAPALETRYDANGNKVEVHGAGYSPHAYQLPAVNNINAVFKTGFEKWNVETDLTVYAPLTQRDVVPVVIVSRSQTGIELTENLSASLVLDARSYVHDAGIEIAFKPIGAVTLRF